MPSDAEPRLRRAEIPRAIHEIAESDFDEITKYEVRIRIAAKVGFNRNPRVQFGLREWNGIHAFLTGSHYFPAQDWNTPRSPPIEEVRRAVLLQAEATDGHPDVEARNTDGEWDGGKPRKTQLAALCECLERESDSRPNPQESG